MKKAMMVIKEQEILGKDFKVYGTADEPLFLAKNVAEWIGYSKSGNGSYHLSMMVKTVDPDEKMKATILVGGQNREVLFLTEDGLYEVLMQSRMSIARQFKKEVKKILKSIRKTGEYKSQNKLPKTYIEALESLVASEKEKERALLLVEEKTKTINMLVHENKLYTTTEIAKEMNLTSARKLNKILNDERIQFKQNSTWVLYSRYSNLGYVSIKQNCLDNGKIVYDRKWTGEGREFILSKFNTKNEVMYN